MFEEGHTFVSKKTSRQAFWPSKTAKTLRAYMAVMLDPHRVRSSYGGTGGRCKTSGCCHLIQQRGFE